ncbi:hypothetical protein JCM3765_006447 [Sporobolomyces pararoseus]
MSLIRQLRIELQPSYDPEGDHLEAVDLFSPSSQRFRVLLSTLNQVKIVAIGGSSRLASVVLEIGTSCLPKLEDLHLVSTFSGFDDPFHPSFYTNVLNFPKLEAFFLTVWRRASRVRHSTRPLPKLTLPNHLFYSVSLTGPLSPSSTSVKHLLLAFGLLGMVQLRDTSGVSQVHALLDGIKYPSLLHILELTQSTMSGVPSTSELASALAKFPSLDCIGFGGSCAPLTSSFYSLLRSLPLKTLAFESEADVNLSELTKLISGPRKHESLEAVWFENVEGEIGTRIEDVGEPYSGPDGETWGPYPDWELPQWTDSFEPRGLRKFLKVAEQEGIQIRGKALEALKVEEEFARESDFLSGYTNSFSFEDGGEKDAD